MKKLAYILAFLFVAFLATPTVIAYIDKSVDVSFAFNVNEEENSSKNQLGMEYNLEDLPSNYKSIHFLQEQKKYSHYYNKNYNSVYMDVISPPPQRI